MSSDRQLPDWPAPVQYRPRRVAYIFAIVLPIVLVLALVSPLAVGYGLRVWRAGGTNQNAASNPGPSSSTEGSAGVGDPYFPDYGSSGYDAGKYTISLDWDPKSQLLKGQTKITARSTQQLGSFYLDLALNTNRVIVNGAQAQFERSGFQDVKITPQEPIAAGSDFEVLVNYSGEPGKIARGQVSGWWTTNQEWTAAGEPESSAWWFPANDHPSDPALMDVSVRAPAGLEVISVGRLESRDSAAETAFDTWHWVARQPMATYLSFVSIGQFQIEQGMVDNRPFVYAVSEQLSQDQRLQAFAQLRTTGAVIRVLETMFGPYPFSEVGGIVPAADFRFGGLETQTRPVYQRGAILNADFAPGLMAHELAHMWFGDNVTVQQWNDIFITEAYASWAQWGYAERQDGIDANRPLNGSFEARNSDQDFWRITMIDPGKDQLFSTVYSRGPMTLQALRNVIGDRAFFDLAREWGQDPGTRSLEEWMIKAQSKTTIDLVPFFQAWIFSPAQPARTPANGFTK